MTYFIDNDYKLYKVGETLGKGGGGETFKLHPLVDTDGKQYVVPKNSDSENTISPGYIETLDIPSFIKESSSETFVLKEFNGKNARKKGVEQEAKVSSKLYFKAKPDIILDKFVITDYMEGEALDIIPTGNLFTYWEFKDRIDFAWQLALQLNQIHNNTVRGEAVLHLDIKGPNMILRHLKDLNKERVNVQLIDFDLSQSHCKSQRKLDINSREITSSDQLRQVFCVGTSLYVSPEVINGHRRYTACCAGARTDIYSCAPLIWTLFGAIDPFYDKWNFFINNKNSPKLNTFISKISFNQENLLENVPVPEWLSENINLINEIKTFLIRLGALDYYERPSTDDVLSFFTNLRNLNMIYEHESFTIKNKDKETREMYEHDIKQIQYLISNLANNNDPIFKIILGNINIKNLLEENTESIVIIFKYNNDWSFIEKNETNNCFPEPKMIQEEEMKVILNDFEKNTNPKLNQELYSEAKRIFHDIEKKKYIEKQTVSHSSFTRKKI